MKLLRRFTLIFIIFLLVGCAAHHNEKLIYNGKQHEPKPDDYIPVVLKPGQPNGKYKIIGQIKIIQNPTTFHYDDVFHRFQELCREMGGDGLLDIRQVDQPENPLMPIKWLAEVFVWKVAAP